MAKKSAKQVKPSASTPSVRVKKGSEVLTSIQNFLNYNLHGRFNTSLSKKLQTRLVAYGPWIAIALVIVVLPELLILAKNGTLMTFTGFFDTILFNQSSWVVMLVLLSGIMLLVDGLSDLFNKKLRGWQRVYAATLINASYILWQLVDNISQPAAPILSLIAIFAIIFALLDVKKYYR